MALFSSGTFWNFHAMMYHDENRKNRNKNKSIHVINFKVGSLTSNLLIPRRESQNNGQSNEPAK